MINKNITCPKCGASISGESLFCNFCGSAITDVTDILKEKAHLEIQKEKTENVLKVEKESRRSTLNHVIPLIILSIVLLLPLLIVLIKY